jgi:hypothetical protein
MGWVDISDILLTKTLVLCMDVDLEKADDGYSMIYRTGISVIERTTDGIPGNRKELSGVVPPPVDGWRPVYMKLFEVANRIDGLVVWSENSDWPSEPPVYQYLTGILVR